LKIVEYLFDVSEGDVVIPDSSGNGNEGRINPVRVGAVPAVVSSDNIPLGYRFKALKFAVDGMPPSPSGVPEPDDQLQFLGIPLTDSIRNINTTKSFTVSFWAYHETLPKDAGQNPWDSPRTLTDKRLFCPQHTCGAEAFYIFVRTKDLGTSVPVSERGELAFTGNGPQVVNAGGIDQSEIGGTTSQGYHTPINRWIHITGVLHPPTGTSPGKWQIWVNGDLKGEDDALSKLAEPGTRIFPEAAGVDIRFGNFRGLNRPRPISDGANDYAFNGYLTGIRLYDHAQTKSEILQDIRTDVQNQQCFILTDKSHFSKDAVDGSTFPVTFEESLYVVMEGFLPSELGITLPIPNDITAIAPVIQITNPDGSNAVGISAIPEELLLEDSSLPDCTMQRFTFKYAIRFDNANSFPDGVSADSLILGLLATKDGFNCTGRITLINQPNPYMLDGQKHWLSTDLRVFQISEGESRFGHTVGDTPGSAITYIQNVLNDLNNSPTSVELFNTISTDQSTSQLELSRTKNGNRVFNFAIAKVRYRGRTVDATDAHVFFRMFTTANAGFEYDPNTTYESSMNSFGDPIPVLGLRGGEIATIPFFAESRVNTSVDPMSRQQDSTNTKTINATGGSESATFFGCWLDFNQTELRFPVTPSNATGPYLSGLKSIQELIRGAHQCLISEIHFSPDPIPLGDTPGSNDNLSQRNLIISESDNPGNVATRIVQHTFEIKPTERNIPKHVQMINADSSKIHYVDKDEVMIRWGNLPRDTKAFIFMSEVNVSEIIHMAATRMGPETLKLVDEHTIQCTVSDVTYIPIPANVTKNIACLLTLELPEGIKHGQNFNIIVHHISSINNKVLGAFQLMIPVSNASALLPTEERKYSVLKHVSKSIPDGNRWKPVFHRYLNQIEERVHGWGGTPEDIEGSPDGDKKSSKCAIQWKIPRILLSLLVLIGLFVISYPTILSNAQIVLLIILGLIISVILMMNLLKQHHDCE